MRFRNELHLLAELEVERAERLVEEEHARPAHERARERDPLLLAAGELARLAVPNARELDEPQHVFHAPLDLASWGLPAARGRRRCCRAIERCGKSAYDWKTVLTSRLYGGCPTTSRSPRKIVPSVGSSKPPIMRSVVVLPQPEGPSSAKNRPCSTSSERSSTATTSSKRFVTRFQADVGDALSHAAPHGRAPVVDLLAELEVEEALGRDDAVERADAVRQLEQVPPVRADELDEHVELAGGDDDVAGLVPARDLVGDGLGRARRADADHRLGVEPEPERVRDGGDLEDVVVAEARVARADGRLGDAEPGRDAAERLAPVLLQRLDDALVDRVDLPGPTDRPAPNPVLDAAQCEAIRARRLALRQLGTAPATRRASPPDECAQHGAEERVGQELVHGDPRAASERRPGAVPPVGMSPVDECQRRPQRGVLRLRREDAGLHAPKPRPFEGRAEDGAVGHVQEDACGRPPATTRDESAEQADVGVRGADEPLQHRLARSPGGGRDCACSRAPHYRAGGISTRLMTWMTPFDAITSAFVTFALLTKTFAPETRMRTFLPFSVFADESLTTSAAVTFPETTW